MSLVGEDDGKGGVRVTNAAIYNAVVELGGSVRDLTGKVDDLVRRDNDADEVHADLDQRLRVVEEWKAEAAPQVAQVAGLLAVRWKMAGAIGLATTALGVGGYFTLTQLVHR